MVTKDGIQTDPSKIEKIVNYPIPKSITQVRAFLGLASYYRRFIKNFAAIARPLHDQTKTSKNIPWTQKTTDSFEKLKQLLTTAPVLARPDFNKPFLLVTDASKAGLGCNLTQLDENGHEHPISDILDRKVSVEVANRFGATYATFNNYANKVFRNRQRGLGGRLMVVSAQTKRLTKLQVVQGQLKTAREVHDKLMELGYYISYKTAINVLKSMNFFATIKVKKTLSTAKHMKRRLAWAKKHQNWTTDDWRCVVFSDETKVYIWGSDGCKYYWPRPGDPLKPHHIGVTVKLGGGSLKMWGCKTHERPGYACQIYDGTMNSDFYQQILGTTLRETMKYYDMDCSTAYFQHDGDPKHRSKSTVQ
ncbi:hypothetical protein G6F43_012362 [Rhizopus delemar]|nr:hypothetical protein G6F43_012362 [Rhizopus delemar]